MKIVTLLENHTVDDTLIHKHGVSLYIETRDRCILLDTGPDDSFITNAEKLGVDLAGVDYLIISHGHYDHGGGLAGFLGINDRARVILHREALDEYFSKRPDGFKYIGLDCKGFVDERFLLLEENTAIEPNIHVIMNFDKSGFVPSGNQALFRCGPGGDRVNDEFRHEIALLITEDGKNLLTTGCSHSGIGNMMRSVRTAMDGIEIDVVIGGFHIYNPSAEILEDAPQINDLIDELRVFPSTVFYTGHCTGLAGFDYLQKHMKNEVRAFHSGTVINI